MEGRSDRKGLNTNNIDLESDNPKIWLPLKLPE